MPAFRARLAGWRLGLRANVPLVYRSIGAEHAVELRKALGGLKGPLHESGPVDVDNS